MKDIEYYISQLKSGVVKVDTTNGGRDKTPVFFEDCVLLCTQAYIAEQYQMLAPYINRLAEQYSGTSRILQTKIIPENLSGESVVCASSDAYILVEKAKGRPIFFKGFVKADKFKVISETREIVQRYYNFLYGYLEELDKIGSLTEAQFSSYVSTAVKLIMDKDFPLGCEKAGDNIFIDEDEGLTFIDLGNKNHIENQEGNDDPVSKIIDMILFGGKNGDCEVDLDLSITRDNIPLGQLKDFIFTIKEPLSEDFVKGVTDAYNKILSKICPCLLSNGITEQMINEYLIKLSQRISLWKSRIKSEEQLLIEVEQVRRELIEKPITDSEKPSQGLNGHSQRTL